MEHGIASIKRTHNPRFPGIKYTATCLCGWEGHGCGIDPGFEAYTNLRTHIGAMKARAERPCHGYTKQRVIVRHGSELQLIPSRPCKGLAMKGSKYCAAHQR